MKCITRWNVPGMCRMVSAERPDQDQGRQFPTLSGRIVGHGILDFLVSQREIAAFAKLVLVDIIGIHQYHRNSGFLFQFIAQLLCVFIVDQCKILIPCKRGAVVDSVNAGHAFPNNFVSCSL